MSRQILRETIAVDDAWHTLEVHGPIVYVATRGEGYVEMWFLSDSAVTHWSRTFRVFGTGQEVPDSAAHIRSTMSASGQFIWHLFEDAR